MEKFIPYEKLSKKEKRKIDQAKRHLGQVEPRHPEARKQQGIQQKKSAGLEEGISESCALVFIRFVYI